MWPDSRVENRTFRNFEERERYLRDDLGAPIPRRHQGASVFWSDLKTAARKSAQGRRNYAFVAPNPLDSLAFDRVHLILRAIPATRQTSLEIDKAIEDFGLEHLVHRFVYTLSGGEALRVAMAKCALQWPVVDKLILAAPWTGLSSGNFAVVNEVINRFHERAKPVEMLNLEGDDNFEAEDGKPSLEYSIPSFRIKLSSLRIPLADPDKATELPFAEVRDLDATNLESPCIISGENGNGKSLLIKAMAGAIDYVGKIVVGKEDTGPVRLIFQDVSSQMLLGTASLNWELSHNKLAKYLNDRLLEKLTTLLSTPSLPKDSLLCTKVAMVALRLSVQPASMILDEPDWGLSRSEALAFFHSVTDVCHFQNTPLIVVTHRKWFDNFCNSCLSVRRTENTRSHKLQQFTINLDRA